MFLHASVEKLPLQQAVNKGSAALKPLLLPVPRSGGRSPNPELLMGCLRIYAGEVVIDVIKHAVLGKFNEIRWVHECMDFLGPRRPTHQGTQ